MKQKDEIAYYVAVGSNGIGYETRYDDLAVARRAYKFRTVFEDEVTLYKYNFTKSVKKIINHFKLR